MGGCFTLVRTIDQLPTTDSSPGYIQVFQNMASALKQVQPRTGLECKLIRSEIITRPRDLRHSLFFTFGLALWHPQRAAGLARSTAVVAKAVASANRVRSTPMECWVTSKESPQDPTIPAVTYDYNEVNKDYLARAYGVGAFLLAGSEVLQLAPGS